MADHVGIVHGLVKLHPNRLWTLRELAGESGLPLSETRAAVERLIARGELIRRGGEYYRQPNAGKAEQQP